MTARTGAAWVTKFAVGAFVERVNCGRLVNARASQSGLGKVYTRAKFAGPKSVSKTPSVANALPIAFCAEQVSKVRGDPFTHRSPISAHLSLHRSTVSAYCALARALEILIPLLHIFFG